MLKITYTENGFFLERLTASLETWLANRVLVCLRATAAVTVEPSTASLLLPINLPYFRDLKAIEERTNGIVRLDLCDDYSIEVSLQGTWVASNEDSEEGIFVCSLEDNTEFFLNQLWKEGKINPSLIEE